jgi:GAF domain-containing protein
MESSGQMDVMSLMSVAMDEALHLTGLNGGNIWSVTESNGLQLITERNTSEATSYGLREKVIQIGDRLCADCVREKKPIVLKTRDEVLDYASRDGSVDEGIRFYAAFPIVSKEKSLGVLCIFTYTDYKPTERSLKLVETLTSQMSLGIENANLYMKISRQVENLENLVKERTKDLETKNSELARMNKMFVGREIRMAELKKQIAEK